MTDQERDELLLRLAATLGAPYALDGKQTRRGAGGATSAWLTRWSPMGTI